MLLRMDFVQALHGGTLSVDELAEDDFLALCFFVLKAVLLYFQSTCSKISLVYPVLSRIYQVSGGACMSLVICVFSLLLLVISLETKHVLTVLG